MFARLSVSALALLAALPAHAQTADDLTRVSESGADVVVTANRAERPRDEVGQSVTVLTEAEIKARQSQMVVDLLRTVPGVTVTRSGGPGTVVGLNIRGAENDQNVVLIDGVKLNDPSGTGGGFNFGNLLTGNIRRIEVVRGSQSTLWGSQAIGGVVNLLTAAPTDELAVNARGEYGWRDTAQAVANASGRVGPAAISVGGGYYRTDGFSAFNEERGGTERDGYENYGANAKLVVDLTSNVQVDLRGYYSHGRVDQDGFLPDFSFGDTREYSETEEMIGYAGLNASFLDGRFRNRIGFAYTRTDRENLNPDPTLTTTFDANGTNERFEYQGILDATDWVSLVFGAEHERSRFDSRDSFGGQDGGRANLTSFYGQATLRPVSGLTVTGGVRHDDHNRFGGATTFSASGTYTPNGGATLVRASYGEGFKVPSLYQLYSVYGNQMLRPEESKSWDAGLTQRFLDGGIEISGTYFHRDTNNQIDFASCFGVTSPICETRPFGYYDNIQETRAEGVEATLTLRPVEQFTVAGQYSFIDARNRITGLQLARRPRETFSVVTDYAFPFGLNLGATLSHVGASFENASNLTPLEGYVLADLRASIAVTDKVELYGRVENLFDERYETVFRYGTAGRAAYGGVRLKL